MNASKSSNSSILTGLVVGLLISVGLIYLLILTLASDSDEAMDQAEAQQASPVAQRTRPVVTLADLMGEVEKADEPGSGTEAKPVVELYNGACAACHNAGVAGAPKLGDRAAWEPRYANGIDVLVKTAISGKGAMPPNGASAYNEADLRRTIEYMLGEAGLMAAADQQSETAATETSVEQAEPAPVADIPAVVMPASDVPGTQKSGVAYDLAAGEQAYRASCFACHDVGAAGAPMLGDSVAWSPRVATGFDSMLASVLNGKGAMPPKGGATYLADSEVANIVAFMIERAR